MSSYVVRCLISKKSGSVLATWLRGLDAAELERVLAARPDAVSAPEPRSVGELADRLQRPASVALALPRLALPCLQVAEAAAALTVVSRDGLAGILGATHGDRAHALDAVLAAMADRALVWPTENGLLHMAAPLRSAWNSPLGLDAPLMHLLAGSNSDEVARMVAELGVKPAANRKETRLAALVEHHSDPARVAALVATAPAATRKLLERRAHETPERPGFVMFGTPQAGPRPAEQWALERGLLIRDRRWSGPARMPAEVALALRGADWHAPFTPVPPDVRSVPVTAPDVEREATAASMAFAAHAVSVLGACAAAPPARLKAGGVGARELSRIGKATQCDEIVVRLALEAASAAGLLARDGDPGRGDRRVRHLGRAGAGRPTHRAAPGMVGAPADPRREPRRGRQGSASARRGAALRRLRTGPARAARGRGAAPGRRRGGELRGAGGAARVAPPARRRTASGTARFGSDLMAVVTGTPSAPLLALLDSVADRETAGAASVWRFSPRSVRRALDTGLTLDALTADLASVAVESLPQPLSYLIQDTARGHGRVRIASAACVIHGEEPALLAELAAHRKLSRLGLRQLAPTVLISRTPPDKTLAALRDAGYAPVAEKPDGSVRIERAQQPRAASPVPPPRLPGSRRRPQQTGDRTADVGAGVDLPALATRLLGAPQDVPEPDPYDGRPYASDTEEIIAGHARNLAFTDVRQLAHAVDNGQAITIEYVATSGNATVRTLSRLELDAPYLHAWCHLRNDERVFTISRIHGVMPS